MKIQWCIKICNIHASYFEGWTVINDRLWIAWLSSGNGWESVAVTAISTLSLPFKNSLSNFSSAIAPFYIPFIFTKWLIGILGLISYFCFIKLAIVQFNKNCLKIWKYDFGCKIEFNHRFRSWSSESKKCHFQKKSNSFSLFPP